ncbi:MAG: hypothetical protein LBR41_00895 [Rickettsiales bacterium]|jgi:hypothetical protein|nr:hypothetical protein [Rickettsiales bacterium]
MKKIIAILIVLLTMPTIVIAAGTNNARDGVDPNMIYGYCRDTGGGNRHAIALCVNFPEARECRKMNGGWRFDNEGCNAGDGDHMCTGYDIKNYDETTSVPEAQGRMGTTRCWAWKCASRYSKSEANKCISDADCRARGGVAQNGKCVIAPPGTSTQGVCKSGGSFLDTEYGVMGGRISNSSGACTNCKFNEYPKTSGSTDTCATGQTADRALLSCCGAEDDFVRCIQSKCPGGAASR